MSGSIALRRKEICLAFRDELRLSSATMFVSCRWTPQLLVKANSAASREASSQGFIRAMETGEGMILWYEAMIISRRPRLLVSKESSLPDPREGIKRWWTRLAVPAKETQSLTVSKENILASRRYVEQLWQITWVERWGWTCLCRLSPTVYHSFSRWCWQLRSMKLGERVRRR